MSYFRFWPVLRGLSDLQDGLQQLDGLVEGAELRALRPADGDVDALVRPPTERDAHDAGAARLQAGGLQVDGHLVLPLKLRDQVAKGVHVRDGRVVLLDRVDGLERLGRAGVEEGGLPAGVPGRRGRSVLRGGRLLQQGAETEGSVEAAHLLRVGAARAASLPVEFEGHLAVEGDQPGGQAHGLAAVGQLLAHLVAGHLVQVLVEVLDAAELLDQAEGRLRSDAGHAGDVVAGVAGQGEHVDNLLGRQALGLLEALGVEHGLPVLVDVEHAGGLVDELLGVLVGGDDDGLDALLSGAAGEGGQHVVRLLALGGEDGDVEHVQ